MSAVPKIAIVYYTTYGHIRTMANTVKAAIDAAGCEATLLQVPETLPGKFICIF